MNNLLENQTKENILKEYYEYLEKNSFFHFGYPYNLEYNFKALSPFLNFTINNLGDPFVESNYKVHSRFFELKVLNYFADLWKIPDSDFWGYVTNSGTEGNLQAMMVARENFPEAIVYTSEETHYSIFKALHLYKMQVEMIHCSYDGCMKLDELKDKISFHKNKDIIINANIGTTVKGAVDNLIGIFGVLEQLYIPLNKVYIHCDGALFAMILPFIDKKNKLNINFNLLITSISVSGHKFLGIPMPCGIFICRKNLMDKVKKPIEYLNSVDSTITGSRNGFTSLFMWNSLVEKGLSGLKKDTEHCLRLTKYVISSLKDKNISCFRNALSNTIVFEKPNCNLFIQKWQLACQNNIAHIIIMPSTSMEKINLFLIDIDQLIKNNKIKIKCIFNEINRYCLCSECN